MAPKILVICGPTACGKTALAVELALGCGGEVVSADSMQVYRRMDVGTAKPTHQEMRGVPHHMLDVAEPWEDYSVARYTQQAGERVEEILSRGRLPIVAGGTGLYIDALLTGGDFAPFSGKRRQELRARLEEEGLPALYRELEGIDPQRAAKLHPNDEKRILRALEVWYETGETITQHDLRAAARPPRYEALRLGLSYRDRSRLYARIDARVDEMMDRGLLREVEALLDEGLSPGCTAMQAIGYKELSAALRGETSLSEAVEEVKLRSRQYAKRQLTWFRRTQGVNWILWDGEPNFSLGRQISTDYMEDFGLG